MLLGGACRDRVRVYQGAGGRDGEEAADSARRLNEEWGFTAFKTSPFLLSPDVARWGRICAEAAKYFEEIRQHAPADFEFAFDPHAKIFEPVRALQLANALAPYDPYFYEEPLRPEHTACLGAAAPADADPLGHWRVPLHPLGIPRPDGGPSRRHHPAGCVRVRRPARNAQNRRHCRGSLRHCSAAQPHGTGGHCGQCALCLRPRPTSKFWSTSRP